MGVRNTGRNRSDGGSASAYPQPTDHRRRRQRRAVWAGPGL